MSSNNLITAQQKYFLWRICAWAGPVFLVGYVATWSVLGFNLPPFEPSISSSDLFAHYVDHNMRIRIAFVGSVFFMPFYFVFSSVISRIMQKIEGADGPMSIVEQMGGATTTVVGMVSGICWLAAAFRIEEKTPELVRQLHDFGWLFFDTTYMVTTLQMVALGLVLLCDRRSKPLFPQWVAWLTLAVAALFVPLSLLPFFYSGPFAWSGVFCYWISLGGFFVEVLVLCYYVFKAINQLEQEETLSS